MADLQYFSELNEDMEKVSRWLKESYWLSTEEKRKAMDYEEEISGQVLVPSNLVPIEDLGSFNLDGGENVDEL